MGTRLGGPLLLLAYGMLEIASILHPVKEPNARVSEILLFGAIASVVIALVFLGRRPLATAPKRVGWDVVLFLFLAILWSGLGLQLYYGVDIGNRSPQLQRFAAIGFWMVLIFTTPYLALVFSRRLPGSGVVRVCGMPLILSLLGVGVAIKIAGIVWETRPAIDVWEGLQAGAQTLSRGLNPYAESMVGAARAGRTFGNPWGGYVYPPATLLLSWPFVSFFGDVRYLYVLSDLLAALLLVFLGRRLGGNPSNARYGELAALLVMFHPSSFAKTWTDLLGLPLLFAIAVLERRRHAGMAQAALVGFLLSLKQYLVFLAPLFVFHARRTRWVLVMFASGVATAVPFLLWGPRELFDSMVLYHFRTPFRPDGMTLASFLHHTAGIALPGWIGPAAAAAVLVAAGIWGRHRGLTGVAAWGSACYLLLFGGSAYAFPNYYHFVMGLLLLGGMLALAEPHLQR